MNSVGLELESTNKLSQELNRLLAYYQVFQMNVKGFHWNLKEDFFLEMYEVFERLHNNLNIKIDEIAERIAMLENTPLHTFVEYLGISKIKPTKDIIDAKEATQSIIARMKILIKLQVEISSYSKEMEDDSISDLMNDYLKEQEKQIWMFCSFLDSSFFFR